MIGRSSQLDRLEKTLFAEDQPAQMALLGMPGIGKTQIALKLAYRARVKYPACSVFWVPATNIESLQQAYREIGLKLQIPGLDEEQAYVKRLVQSYLTGESAGRWLLIFDGADDEDMWISSFNNKDVSYDLINYLPKSRQGSLLFTTRRRKVAVKLAQHIVIEVTHVDENVATQVLRYPIRNQKLLNDHQNAIKLLKQLDFLPLAIAQAAAYTNETEITPAQYLSLLEDFGDNRRYRNIEIPVYSTWQISFEQIKRRDPQAADYLWFMSCLDANDIPQSLLPPAQSRKKETDAIETSNAYSFVSRRPRNQSLDLHSLVHLVTQDWSRGEGLLSEWIARNIARLEDIFPHDDPRLWRAYLPHVRYVLDFDVLLHDIETSSRLFLLSDGRYDEAQKPFSQAQETFERMLGAVHPSTLISMANLASTYWNQGRFEEAEKLEEQVMATRKRVLGEEHPDTLISMGNLALTYSDQGRWKEAEELNLYVTAIRKRVMRASMLADQDAETTARYEASEGSVVESIFSLASHSTIPSTVPSSSRKEVLASAPDQLVTLLIEDPILHSLFLASVEAKNIGGERFARNFRRLLRIFARDLKIEAQEPRQNHAAHLFQSHATYVTQSIRAIYDFGYRKSFMPVGRHSLDDEEVKEERLEKYLQERKSAESRHEYSLSMKPDADPDISEANPEPPKSDVEDLSSEEGVEESQVGNELRNIEQLGQFIVGSNAYSKLREAFKEFVQPSCAEATKAPKASGPTDTTIVEVPKVIKVTMASEPPEAGKAPELSGDPEQAQRQTSLVPRLLWHHFWAWLREAARQTPRPGCQRITWTCVCGFTFCFAIRSI